MGTRGAFGFIKDGIEKVTYNHYDSYPEGLGENILAALADNVTIEKLKEVYDRIEMVSRAQEEPTQKQIEACNHFADVSIRSGDLSDWYVLLRKAQGHIDAYWAEAPLPYMIDDKGFLIDSVFCEYAYIVNLDTEMLEFYSGFNKNPNANGRYASQIRENKKEQAEKFYGVVLKLEIPLSEINKDSVDALVKKMCNADEDENEEEIVEKPDVVKKTTMGNVDKNDVEAYLSAREGMVKMEIELPNDLAALMHELADEWTKSFEQEVSASDALSILLTKITNTDFEEIAKKHND